MSRHLIVVHSVADRVRASNYINVAPTGTRVEFKAAKRSLPQNDRMWAMLTDIARQKEHHGRKYTPDVWKMIFLHALNKENAVTFVHSLENETFIPIARSSSDLSKGEMSDMIEMMLEWGGRNGVTFNDREAA